MVYYLAMVIIVVVKFFLSDYERLGDSHIAVAVVIIILLLFDSGCILTVHLYDWGVYCIQVGGRYYIMFVGIISGNTHETNSSTRGNLGV